MKMLFLLALSVVAHAQAARTVTLTWADTQNPAGTTYNIYRANGSCSGTPTFTQIATGITVKTYQDVSVNPGSYCYTTRAAIGGIESVNSNLAGAVVTPFAPTGLTVVVQ